MNSSITLFTLINILGAVNAFVAGRAGAGVAAIYGTCIADGVNMAGMGGTRVLEMTQQPRLPRRAAAVEASHTVNTSRAVKASCPRAVIDVRTAVRPRPSVDADTGESAWGQK